MGLLANHKLKLPAARTLPVRVVGSILLFLPLLSGCASLTNPAADGIAVRHLPRELLAPSKNDSQTIPLTSLQRPPQDVYRLDTGDVVGVYIEGVLDTEKAKVPLHDRQFAGNEQSHSPPLAGFPFTVADNGSITLPSGALVMLRGLTLEDAASLIRIEAKKFLAKGSQPSVIVSLLQQRRHKILVFRQEAASFNVGPEGLIPSSARGTGHVIELAGNENDVLHALAKSGGLPSLDAYNEIIVYRNSYPVTAHQGMNKFDIESIVKTGVGQTVRIPIRSSRQQPCIPRLQDITLHTGDVVFLEARDDEVFFTGGLLPPGKHVLPRDRDLDVVEAITQVRGPFFNGAFGGSNLSGTLIAPGIGNPSPSLLTVLRRVPDGRQVSIVVDLRRALRHPEERILVTKGDVLILQEKPQESITRYFTQTLFNFEMVWQAIRGGNATGVVNVSTPDRIFNQLGNVNITPR